MEKIKPKVSYVSPIENKECIVDVIIGIISIAVLTIWYLYQEIILALLAFIILAIWWFIDWRRKNKISKEFEKWIKGLTKNLSCSILLVAFSVILSICLVIIFGVSKGLDIIFFEQLFKKTSDDDFFLIIAALIILFISVAMREIIREEGLVGGLKVVIGAFFVITLLYCLDHGSLLPYWITGVIAYMLIGPLISLFISMEKHLSSFLDTPSTIAVTSLSLIPVFILFISIYIIYSDSIRLLLFVISLFFIFLIVWSESRSETTIHSSFDKKFISFSRYSTQVFTIIIVISLLTSAILGVTPGYESRRYLAGANTELVASGIGGISSGISLTCGVALPIGVAMFSNMYPYSNPIKGLNTLNYSLMEKNAENLQKNAENLLNFSFKGNEKSWRETNIFVFYIYLGKDVEKTGVFAKNRFKLERNFIEFVNDFYKYRIEYKSPYHTIHDNYTDQISHETIYICKYFTKKRY